MRLLPWLLVLAVLSLVPLRGVSAGPKVDPRAEAKAKEKLAEEALAGAGTLIAAGARAEALRLLADAEALGAAKDKLEPLQTKAKALPEGETSAEGKAAWKTVAAELAKGYDKLGALPHTDADAARFEGYLFHAAELDPSKTRIAKLFTLVKAAMGNKAKVEVGGRMLARLRDLDPEGAAKYDALEQDMAAADLALIKGKHPMVGWLSLPSGWTKKGPWQVLVAVDGSGSNFVGAARNFAGARGGRKFLVLAPVSLSNTNALEEAKYSVYDPALLRQWDARRVEFDIAGLESLLEVLRTRYGADEKIAITGFSGGGNLCYSMTLQRPERVWAAAPACANYQPGLANGAKPVEGGGPPVHVLTGANDEHKDQVFGSKPGIEGQSDWAMDSFQKLGFTRVKRTMLPGVGHSSCAKEVWTFLDEVQGAK
jgi:predicted esterase